MKKCLLIILLIGGYSVSCLADSELDSLLSMLDAEIGKRSIYQERKEQKIADIKSLLAEEKQASKKKFKYTQQLVKAYSNYTFDSTRVYSISAMEIANEIGDLNLQITAQLMQAQILAKSGGYKEALDLLQRIDRKKLDGETLIDYLEAYRKVYEDLSYYASIEDTRQRYYQYEDAYSDSLIELISKDSDLYLDFEEKRLRDARDLEACKKINSERLSRVVYGTPAYSLITFQRSLIYELNHQTAERKKYLALSALSDMQAAVRDNASLTKLAMILHGENEVERAYAYIKFSFEDAEFFNSRLRFIEISNIFPVITAAHQRRIDDQNEKLKFMVLVISILSVVLAGLVLSTFRQIKKIRSTRNELLRLNDNLKLANGELQQANDKLEDLNGKIMESDHVKEFYIANFLTICSDFIDKLDAYRKMVKKMVVGRKFEELINKTSDQGFIDNEVNQFYETFDTTFLNIYPDFVEKMNELLQEDQKIELKSGELLNTELRIFALIRLGITDSSNISKLLRYSVNTIYNYRVKIKNKARVSRDEFENFVQNIDAFQTPKPTA